MLLVAMLLVAVLVGACVLVAAGRTVPPSTVEVGLTELEHVLESEALEDSLGPFKEVRRVTRERPVETGDERSGAVDVDAVEKLAESAPPLTEDSPKRVTREEPVDDNKEVERTSRQTKDPKVGGGEQRHFHSGIGQTYHGSPSLSPHVTFNVPPPQVQYTIAQQVAPIPRPLPPPVSNCVGGSCSGGTTIHVHDTHLVTQHVPQTYTATVPFISGYRLTPIIGQKQITLHDWANHHQGGGAIPAQYPVGGGCPNDPYGGYWQHLYTHARNALTAEDLLRPFEEARYFQEPIDQEHNLSGHKEYANQIDDLKHQIEHLESLKENAPISENLIAR